MLTLTNLITFKFFLEFVTCKMLHSVESGKDKILFIDTHSVHAMHIFLKD